MAVFRIHRDVHSLPLWSDRTPLAASGHKRKLLWTSAGSAASPCLYPVILETKIGKMAFCCSRLCAPKQLNLAFATYRSIFTAPKHLASMKVVPFKPAPQEGFDEKNSRLKRPLSPHLTIYSFQLTSVLSISHRITGLALSASMAGLGIGALLLPQSIPAYLAAANLSAGTLFVGKFILAFPFAYHTTNGVRHLVWDMGKALTIKEVYTTGYAMLGVSTIITLILLSL